jgi:hypothetical protein
MKMTAMMTGIFLAISGTAWGVSPDVHCSTLTYVVSNKNYPPSLKTYFVDEISTRWHVLTGRDMEQLDEINVFITCLNEPDTTVDDAFHIVLDKAEHQVAIN